MVIKIVLFICLPLMCSPQYVCTSVAHLMNVRLGLKFHSQYGALFHILKVTRALFFKILLKYA